MKPRLWTSLLVLFVLVVLAAAGQEFLPGPGRLAPRWEFLLSLVIYYGMRREKQMSMTAAVWCGLLTEGFDSLPPGTALLLFIGIGFLCGRTLRGQMSDSLLSCALAGGFLGVCSSFLGIGGGPINVALIIYLFSYARMMTLRWLWSKKFSSAL